MSLARLKGMITGKIMSSDKKRQLKQMIKDKGISAVARAAGISPREVQAMAEAK